MSILSEVIHGKISPQEGVAEGLKWAEALISHSPDLTASVNASVTDLKHAASNALDLAETDIGAAVTNIVPGLETALDAELAKLTGSATVPFNKFINDGADRLVAAVHAELDAFILKWKASLATPPAS
jgi:hypothetical protein